MGWETRNGRGAYYTRSLWAEGRVVREYVGAAESPAAQLAAAEDAMRREHRERGQAERRTEREREAEADLPLEVLAAVSQALLGATLVVAGYRQHARGSWRRRRG